MILDHEDHAIACMVAWVKGPVATLVSPDEIPQHLQEKLSSPSVGFLVFDHDGAPVALRGAASADSGGPIMEFVVLDGVQVPERRITNRVAVVIPVRVSVPEDPAAALIETTSADLSIIGVLLERRPGLGTGPRWKIELVVPGDEPAICCEAVVARQTRTHIGVKFADLQPADHARLEGLLAAHDRATAVPA